MGFFKYFVTIFYLLQLCQGQVGTPPKVDKPKLLNSFLPAGMQIMAHLTELMKYDLRPQTGPTTTTTTTLRPTPSHKPGIYAPEIPPGPEHYFAKGLGYEEYVQLLQRPSSSYFDRYYYPFTTRDNMRSGRVFVQRAGDIPDELQTYFGKGFTDVLRLVNRVEDDYVPRNAEVQVQDFSQNYDDSDFRFFLLRQKQVPPTRAYVTLLSLYDLLNKESKRLGLNKYQGYAENILKDLIESSTGTSAYQLRFVMNKIRERHDTRKPDIIKKIEQLIKDLDQDNSYINDALRYIPPLAFVN